MRTFISLAFVLVMVVLAVAAPRESCVRLVASRAHRVLTRLSSVPQSFIDGVGSPPSVITARTVDSSDMT
jgi:hypothetical protein